MPSPLFPNLNRAQQQAATANEKTKLAQAVASQRRYLGRNLTQSELRAAAQSVARSGSPDRYSMSDWVKRKITNGAFKALGSVGQLVEALLRPNGKSLATDIEQELDAAGYLLRQFGYDVSKSGVKEPMPEPGTHFPTRSRERILPKDLQNQNLPENKPAIEGWIEVVSSNVHSIAYQWNLANTTANGNLLVRFLGGSSQHRTGPGAMYSYKDVPYSVFKAFKLASSKGAFVWDELRVRGTIIGHQYDYHLEDIGNLGRVPRQAGFKRGETGEYFLQRTFRGQRSSLPEQLVRGPRGNLPNWERRSNLKFRAD